MLKRLFGLTRVSHTAAPHGAVVRRSIPITEQRGWRLKSGAWSGSYATRHGTWHGHIQRAGSEQRVLIYDPPAELRRHHKWVCFHADANGWFRIHLHRPPIDGDPSSIILYVERLIEESFKL